MSPSAPCLLLIEDDDSLREVMTFNLEEGGYEVDAASGGREGLSLYDPDRHDVVVSDIRMPDLDGFEVLTALHARNPKCVVLFITAFGGTARALEAMRKGAFHYLEKPVNTGALLAILEKAVAFGRVQRENERLTQHGKGRSHQLIAASQRSSALLRLVDKVANTDATVLIVGESGTGKELVARTLHERSSRHGARFVATNCAAIPGELLESTLFGHRRGAFTGAVRDAPGKFVMAQGGTLFLDEVGELPLELQAKLLRVLQEGEIEPLGCSEPEAVDARILAATHRDLEDEVAAGRFREDLFWRLNVVPIHVPPLRERPEDIPVLLRYFLRKHGPDATVNVHRDLDDALLEYDWPGNVRELENTVERMLILRESDTLTLADLPSRLRRPRLTHTLDTLPFTLPADGLDLRKLEHDVILAALEKHAGNQSATARYLKIPRHVLTYRLEKYVDRSDEEPGGAGESEPR